MKTHSVYKGHTIVQYGNTKPRFEIEDGIRYKSKHPKYGSLEELYEFIDRRERRIQLIMADPRL